MRMCLPSQLLTMSGRWKAKRPSIYFGMFRPLWSLPLQPWWGHWWITHYVEYFWGHTLTNGIFLGPDRRFTMPKFITHEPLALGLLNTGHQTASGTLQPWTRVLTNTEPLLHLMISRMESDYTALKPQMRKPWTGSSVVSRLNLIKVICFGCFYPSNIFRIYV